MQQRFKKSDFKKKVIVLYEWNSCFFYNTLTLFIVKNWCHSKNIDCMRRFSDIFFAACSNREWLLEWKNEIKGNETKLWLISSSWLCRFRITRQNENRFSNYSIPFLLKDFIWFFVWSARYSFKLITVFVLELQRHGFLIGNLLIWWADSIKKANTLFARLNYCFCFFSQRYLKQRVFAWD